MDGNWDIAPNLSRHRPENSLKIFCHFYLGRGRCGTGGAVCATATMQQAYKNWLDCGNPINLQRA